MYKAYELDFTNADLNAFSSSSQSYTHVVPSQRGLNENSNGLLRRDGLLKSMDYISDDGYNNLGTWIDSAAYKKGK
ncbi:hypothetical protein EfmAA242_06390 [Enterococcus faecium]|nr:hypothetical protein EfmAA242_06390 [Enterococcus faecium]